MRLNKYDGTITWCDDGLRVCMSVRICVCMYVCMYVCVCVRMYVCMYVY